MRVILIISLIISYSCAYTQSYNNNWVFGDSIGLNFSTGAPVIFNSGISQITEACAAISDENGNLLFYTNGHTVWNRINNIMPHGDSLDIGYFTPEYGSSMTQGVLIAPMPDNDSLFYIIYIYHNVWGGGNGLKYSVLNTHLNGGLGDIVEKNILLSENNLTEKLQLVKHGNGRDWWLLALTKGEEEGDPINFVKFLITKYGIDGPFYQEYEDTYHESEGTGQEVGYMKFSQQGNKICIAKGTDGDIYDFNRCTGEFTNYINIDTIVANYPADRLVYGIEFSAEGKYCYVASADGSPAGTQTFLYQFCIACPESVQDTKTLIYASDSSMTLFGLLLGSNDKIYMSSYSTINTQTNSSLFVINNPGTNGLTCNLDTLTIFLSTQSLSYFSGLPNMPNYNLGPLEGSECDTLLPIQTALPTVINIYPNPSTGNIFISGSPNDLFNLTLYNLLGENVFEQKNTPGNVLINLPVDNGIYEVVLRSADNIILVEKLVIGK